MLYNEKDCLKRLSDSIWVVNLHQTLQSDRKVHFILDLFDYGELYDLLDKYPTFPEYMAKFYTANVILGLQSIHAKGIVFVKDMLL